MKVSIHGFIGKNHSWSHVHRGLARTLIKRGYEVDLCTTNGTEFIPEDLIPFLKHESQLSHNYDLQLSYTAMINFPKFLGHGAKNRFGIWNYEFTVLPVSPSPFVKFYKFTDKFLPSSFFSKKIFLENGIPEEHMEVVPHGVDVAGWENLEPFKLKTQKKVKILANIAQPHIRKNLPGLLEAFGKAFTNKDDVCLVLKVVIKKPDTTFEVSFNDVFNKFKKTYPQHAECEIISEYLPNIGALYKATDIVFTMTHTECFYMPGLEGLSTNNIIVSPRYGGQLDYLNDDNSLLIDGKIIRAPAAAHYWNPSPYSSMFEPDINQAAEKLQYAVKNLTSLKNNFSKNSKKILDKYSWDAVTDQIIGLMK